MSAYSLREIELMDKQEAGTLTLAELYELRDIKRDNISHLTFSTVRVKP